MGGLKPRKASDDFFDWFEEAYISIVCSVLVELTLPMFDSLRPDPRWQDLVRRIGLPRLLPTSSATHAYCVNEAVDYENSRQIATANVTQRDLNEWRFCVGYRRSKSLQSGRQE